MARKHRIFRSGLPLHVTQRGNNRGNIFLSDADRIRYLDCLVEAAERHDCAIHCYALMRNHFHLLITPQDPPSLAKCMQSLNGKYVKYFNRVHERTGALYEGRFGAKVVDTDAYLKVCYQYIELNPVKDGYCHSPEHYRWSSHRFHACGELDRVVTPHRAYLNLAKSPEARQKRYRGWFPPHLIRSLKSKIKSGV